MPIDESGDREPPLQVDNPRLWAHPALNLRVGADRRDAIAIDGDRLRARMLGVDGEEITVKEHEVGVRLLRGNRMNSREGAQSGASESREMHGSSSGRRISDE
jgi:hypothetical protein